MDLPPLTPGRGAVLHELAHWLRKGGATKADVVLK
jgi:hypothetical protein